MDLSKLPRLSNTPQPPANSNPPSPPNADHQPTIDYAPTRAPMNAAAEIWIGIAVGLILLLAYPRLPQFLSHKLFNTSFAPFIDLTTGQPVPYTSTPAFWSDLGITLFALAMFLEGLLLALFFKPAGLFLALSLTALATLYNAAYLLTHLQPLPLVSALAVAVGGYMLTTQWTLLKTLLSHPQSPKKQQAVGR